MLELRRGHARMTRIDARTALLMTLPPLLWAGNAVVGRLAVGSVPPLMLNCLRWALAALMLLPFGWRALRDPNAIFVRWKYLLAIGLLGVGTYNSLQYLALVTTTRQSPEHVPMSTTPDLARTSTRSATVQASRRTR